MIRARSIALVCLLAVAGCGKRLSTWTPTVESPVIPLPVSVVRMGGSLSFRSPVSVAAAGPGTELLLPALRAWIVERTNHLGSPFLLTTDSTEARITVVVNPDPARDDESYRLTTTDGRVRIDAGGPAGAFYGLQTLRQLLRADTDGRAYMPAVHVEDGPRFPYRGMHLDVGRHFFPVEFVKRYIDLLASYKMNRFHWHLTEDQGWRIQIDGYPRLTTVGSCRAETIIERNFDPFVGDGEEYCGFYTKDEIRDVVAYAAQRFVTIIPEIEMPGHSIAALAAYPALSCGGGPFEVGTRWGVYDDIYCPSESTFGFLEDVLNEVMELFPGEYIHIGGDEAPKSTWESSELAQAVIHREGLADEHELQSYFIRRIEAFLNARGRKLIGWDEILEGGLAPDATVMSWRGTVGGIEAARQGHDVIMSPTSHVYFDFYQGDPAYEPLAIGGYTTLEQVYSFEPVPDELDAAQATHVLGGQANLWTEYMSTTEQVEYMAYPRAIALSEVLWSPKGARDWRSFTSRLPAELEYLDRLGVNYRLPDVTGLEKDRLTLDGVQMIELTVALHGADIRYTLDGSDPGLSSPRYAAPFEIDLRPAPVTVRARAFLPSGHATAPASANFRQVKLRAPDLTSRAALESGLWREYFEGDVRSVDGYIRVPEDGIYEFILASDDGSRLVVGSEVVVDHDGPHGMSERFGQVALKQGFHQLHLSYFQATGSTGLTLRILAPGWSESSAVPADWLFRESTDRP